MRAQVLEEFNKPYALRDIPEPSNPQGKDILVKVLAASYCHTDAVFASGSMWKDLPRVGSHEFAGEIVALGPDVEKSLGLFVGLRVGVPGRAYQPCGTCNECRNNDGDPSGYGVWCTRAGNLGLSSDGGFQEYVLADSRQVAPIPAPLKAVDTAPLMCAGLTIWNALETADINMTDPSSNQGKTVAVIGAGGGLGHLGVQFAAKLGCKVIAVDTSDKALNMLRGIVDDLGQIGKQVRIANATTDKAEDIRIAFCGQPEPSLEGEKGADACLILPESQQALDYGLKLLRSHSTCVLVSFPIDGFHFNPRDIVFRHIRKTTIYKLEELNDLVDAYNQGASGKLVVDLML